jgi:hypothetical protein
LDLLWAAGPSSVTLILLGSDLQTDYAMVREL